MINMIKMIKKIWLTQIKKILIIPSNTHREKTERERVRGGGQTMYSL